MEYKSELLMRSTCLDDGTGASQAETLDHVEEAAVWSTQGIFGVVFIAKLLTFRPKASSE